MEFLFDITLSNELNINVWHMILITSILYHVNDSCSCTYFILHLYIDSISISMNKIHIVMTEVFMLVYIKKKLVLTTFIQRIICSKDICNETILLIRMCRGLISHTDNWALHNKRHNSDIWQRFMIRTFYWLMRDLIQNSS